MFPTPLRPDGRRALASIALAIAVCAALGFALRGTSSSAQGAAIQPCANHAVMSDAEMERLVQERYAHRPMVGAPANPAAAVADTFVALSTRFDTDQNSGTVVDTAYIFQGESILWRAVAGSHTVTNGTGNADPEAGLLFDHAINSATAPNFMFTFDSTGTYPFFCAIHESFNMRGVVVVMQIVDVVPLGGSGNKLGFVSDPTPNPTTDEVSFRFALPVSGRVGLRVVDARGRIVAEPMNRSLEPGTYGAAWDGRTRAGERAAPGVYYLRLTLPGFSATRRVILSR